MYLRIVFHRYAWISNYKNAPNKTSLIAEITVPPNQRIDINKLIDEIIQDLIELGVIETVRSKFL